MDKLVRSIEIPLAKQRIIKAGLYLVPVERLDELCETAADAYRDYPLHNWFNNGKYNPEVAKIIMKASIASIKDDTVIYADSEELNGFAVWAPLGFTGSKSLPFLKNGGIKLLFRCGPGVLLRLVFYEKFAMEQKKKYTGHVDWYLYVLSVRKKAQRKGIAKKLLLPMLEFCDDEKMNIYLETNKESNVSLYNHFGFDLKEINQVLGSEVKHYSMVREPK